MTIFTNTHSFGGVLHPQELFAPPLLTYVRTKFGNHNTSLIQNTDRNKTMGEKKFDTGWKNNSHQVLIASEISTYFYRITKPFTTNSQKTR